MALVTDSKLPPSNAAGFELIAEHLSPTRAAALQQLGLRIVQGRREGIRIWDLDGNSYLNCRSSGGVFNFGHRPAFAVAALERALHEIGDMGDWLLPSASRARGAAALASILPPPLRYSFFTPGGGEAVEVACKLARGVTGRTRLVTAEHGFHGQVGFGLAMDEERDTHWYGPLAGGIAKVPFGDLDALDRAVDGETAAVCMETIPATAGYLVPEDDWWPAVRALCDERGALLILDEVQAGLGRTGYMWACDGWDVAPDLLVTGKGLSGGVYPISACCFGDRVDAFFERDPLFHPSSFGGSELGAAVVEAVVGQVSEPRFLSHVTAMGAALAAGLERLHRRHPTLLARRRGIGLMQALDTHSPELCYRFMIAALDNGVLAIWANNRQETLLIMPPLVVTIDDVDEIVERLDRAAAAAAP